jgi:hypothetical protein
MTQDANATNRGMFTFGVGTFTSFIPGYGPWAFLVAGTVSYFIFPPKYSKPKKLKELGINSAETDIPIPEIFGTVKSTGNWLWKGRLHTHAVKQSSGASGGKKQTVGYKYYMQAAMGICEGPVEVTRMWSNADIMRFNGSSSVTIYAGETDQLIDPTIDAAVDDAVPFRGLCYVVFSHYYVGQDNAQAPVVSAESHKYPYHSDAGKTPYTKVRYAQDIDAVAGAAKGMTMRDSKGRFIVVNRTTIYVWDPTLTTLQKTITIPVAYGIRAAADERAWDVDIIEDSSGRVYVYFGYEATTTLYPCIGRINIGATQGQINTAALSSFNKWTLSSVNACNKVYLCHNTQYSFVCYNVAGAIYIGKFAWNDYGTLLGTYTITAGGSGTGAICASEEFLFLYNGLDIYTFDFLGNLVDSIASVFTGNLGICRPFGSNCLVLHYEYQSGDPFDPEYADKWKLVFYDRSTGELTEGYGTGMYNETYDGEAFWESGETIHIGYPVSTKIKYNKLWAAVDGTITLSMVNVADTPDIGGILCLILDANPAQVIYNTVVNIAEDDIDEYDVVSLADMSDYCFQYGIGISGELNADTEIRDFFGNIMSYVGGVMYPDNDGQQAFKVFRDTDASVATITEDDIVDGSFEKISVSTRDPKDKWNHITVKFTDRMNGYSQGTFPCDHQLDQDRNGVLSGDMDMQWVSNPRTASMLGHRSLKLSVYDTKAVKMDLMPEHLGLEIGQVITAALDMPGFTNQKLRIIGVGIPVFEGGGKVPVICRVEEDFMNTLETPEVAPGLREDLNVDPPTSVRPFVWEAPAIQTGDAMSLRLSAIRYDENVMGCNVFFSTDDLNYQLAGTLYNFCVAGDIHAAVSAVEKIMEIDPAPYPDAFASAAVEEQRNDRSFSLIGELVADQLGLDNLEFVNFREVTDAAGISTMHNCYRGEYYCVPKAHTTDEMFLQVGTDRFLNIPIKDAEIGKIYYIRVTTFNLRGEEQEFDEADTYEYTIKGYTKKSTHTSGLQILDSTGAGMGSRRTIAWYGADVLQVGWQLTNRVGGIDATPISTWPWNRYIPGDDIEYDALIYGADGTTLVATHAVTDGMTNQYYEYTKAQNTTDFGGYETHFWIGIRPRNYLGYLDNDIEKVEIIIIGDPA